MFNQLFPFFLEFLQPRDTGRPITNCRRLRRSRENFWENPARNSNQRLDRIDTTCVARDSDSQELDTTPQSLKSTLVDPPAPDGNRRERWLDNIWLWWNNRKRKYLNNSAVTPRNLKLDNTKIHLRNRIQQQPLGSVCGKFRSRSCSWRWMITGSQRDNRGGIGSSVLVWELHFWDWEIHL